MSKNQVPVITLLSSDEETPPLVNNLLNTKTNVKARKTARKSTTAKMSQISIFPIKPERSKTKTSLNSVFSVEKDNANASQSKSKPANHQSKLNSTSFPLKEPMPESININNLNHSANVTNSVMDLEKNTTKCSINGLPPTEIKKKMPHITITAIPKPSDSPVFRNSRTARKSVSSNSGRHSSPEVQITTTKLNKSPTYQNGAKLSESNQPVRISTCSTAEHCNSNKVTVNNSYSNSTSSSFKASDKSHGNVKESLYVETLKKKARKSFPSSSSLLPPSLVSTLGKGGVSITNVNNKNSVNNGLVGKKSEEVFDLKILKTSPDLSITKVKSDEVNLIKNSNDKAEYSGRTQVPQISTTQKNSKLLNINSSVNNKSQTATIVKSKAYEVPVSEELFSCKNSITPIRKVSQDHTISLSRNNHMINTNEPSADKCIQNNYSSKNNSNVIKPPSRAQTRSLNVKKSSFTDKALADSELDVIILPDTMETQVTNQKPDGAVLPARKSLLKPALQTQVTNQKPAGPGNAKSTLKPALTKTSSSKNKTNVPVSELLKQNQSLKRKNSNSISNPKSSKKVYFQTPPNGATQNSVFVDHHKRIEAIKESLKDLNNDLKQQEKTDKSLSNVSKASITKKDPAIPLPFIREKKYMILQKEKKNTIIPVEHGQEKKKPTIIPLQNNQEKKKDKIIPLPWKQDKKKDTVIPLAHDEEKEDTISPKSHVQKEVNIPLPNDESIVKRIQMGGKEHESFDEFQEFEDLSNAATNDGNCKEIILDAPPERLRKQVTSPKLSLKRKTTPDETLTNGTPVKKLKVSSEAAFEKICSPLQNQDKPTTVSSSTIESVEVNSFPWKKDDDISTIYKKFLHFCKPSMKSSPQEENKIVKTFLKQFQKADVKFVESTSFIELLCKTVLKVKTNPREIFVHLSTLSSRLREHKRLDFSSPLSSSNERSKSTNNVKHIPSDKPETTSHLSSKELKATESGNHFEQSASKDTKVTSHLSSKEMRAVSSSEGIDQTLCNEPEGPSHLSNNYLAFDNSNHSKEIPYNIAERASDLSNDYSAAIDNANHSKKIPDNGPESGNSNLNNHTGQIVGDEPEIQSKVSNLNDKSEIGESTNYTETIPTDKPEISTNIDEPGNDEYSPSLIPSNPVESIDPDDSRPSDNVLNPSVVESSGKGLCMDEFYSRPSTSKEADFVEMLLSSKIPGNTLEEVVRESYRLPLDDLTKDSIEKHQDTYLTSKKVANSIPHSELPVPKINPDVRESHLDKGNNSDSTASFPDKSSKSDPKKHTAPKHKKTDEEKLEERIKFLEDLLSKLDKKIKKLQLKELSLDDLDDEDSTYIREDAYKRKFNKVFAKLCELRKGSSRVGRLIEKRFTYEGSRYEAINKAIEKLVNKRKAAEKFPDYKETLEKVKEVNESHRIGLTSRDEERVAEQIFKDVGKELQRRRILDEEQDLISYCPDDVELDYDPADHDESLKSKLTSNAVEAEKKIDEIMQKYVEMQRDQERVHDNVMEVEETSEDEQNSDIPETEPATPSTDERMDEVDPTDEPLKGDLPAPISYNEEPDIIDIGSSSDASTEPGGSASESKNSKPRPSLLTGGPPIFISEEIEVIEDTNQGDDSSPDLPSLKTLFE